MPKTVKDKQWWKPPPKHNDLVFAAIRADAAADRIKAEDKQRKQKKREEKNMEKERLEKEQQQIEKDKMNDVMPARP